ncbi:CCA tRNA nucleotidyltransferase [Meridianimarinicoccus sp. MJW13]|uniref:CCA tRNA nucleotidyltransferase n=1 Tax=Meridianimarinicoccus sp. MJW13 TaxID=2720031 RepID=UPI0018667F08|nr:CCA tRNA nucleotidyltransferase [Fluviibacterium sp. MJW13]
MTRIDADWLADPAARAVCAALTEAGHRIYFVGGCVRNTLLGRPVSDLDLATDARPEQTEAAAAAAGLKSVPTGKDHGTITLVAGGQGFEVTTFRHDIETDGRHAVVRFSDKLEDDAARRDFTMNALYATPDGQILDPVGGLEDLRAGRLRFIGDADQRIAEDYLRILRFFRFHAWYADPAGGMDAEALAACAAGAEGLDRLAAERVGQEILKLLAAPDPGPAVAAMEQAGLLSRVLPGATAHALPVLIHLEGDLPADPLRRLAVLGGEDVSTRLRLSRTQARRLDLLQQGLADPCPVAEAAYRHGPDAARDIALLLAASLEQPLPATLEADLARGGAARFPIKAADLMPRLQGKALGTALTALEARWIASGFTLDKSALLQLPEAG